MQQHALARVAIVDYGMGNIGSVLNALDAIGVEGYAAQPEDLFRATHVILPGVGAFGDAMARLRSRAWIDPLEDAVLDRGVPLLGICLGMQLLLSVGTEHGEHKGLGWIEGEVVKLPADVGVRVPHIGWNDAHPTRDSMLFDGLAHPTAFYFVHSYAVRPSHPGVITSVTNHGVEFVATVEQGHILGAQFHPEKSHRAGLRLLRNFTKLAATRC